MIPYTSHIKALICLMKPHIYVTKPLICPMTSYTSMTKLLRCPMTTYTSQSLSPTFKKDQCQLLKIVLPWPLELLLKGSIVQNEIVNYITVTDLFLFLVELHKFWCWRQTPQQTVGSSTQTSLCHHTSALHNSGGKWVHIVIFNTIYPKSYFLILNRKILY